MNIIITISGNAGSGKSTAAKNLTDILHAQRIYVGGIRREMARAKGVSLDQLNQYALNHPETDVDVDKETAAKARLLAKDSIVIVEGRVQWHFIPESIKLYLKVDIKEGARRIFKQIQNSDDKAKRNEDDVKSIEEMIVKIQEREANDAQRYQKYYNIDHTIESQYDLVIDTSTIPAEEVLQQILAYINPKIN